MRASITYPACAVWSMFLATCFGAGSLELVPGDSYQIAVERRGVSEEYSGNLVHADQEWIVLHLHSEGRNETGVPVLQHIAPRLFRNVGIGRIDEHLWIPRGAAKVARRTQWIGSSKVQPELPKLPIGQECHVDLAGGTESVSERGKLVSLDENLVKLIVSQTHEENHSVPVLSQIPVVGAAFTKKTEKQVLVDRKLDRSKILCIHVNCPCDADAPFPNRENQQANNVRREVFSDL